MIGPVLLGLTRFLVGGHPRWIGSRPTMRQRIYFANHGSHLDTIVLWFALPDALRATTHPVAARDYWGTGRLRRHIGVDVLNSILIDRSGQGPKEDVLRPLHDALDLGRSLIIFPEGTRRTERLPGPFKAGLYNLAAAHRDVELIPVYLENLSRAFPKGALIPAPIACTARFGSPIGLRPDEDRSAFLERARQAVVDLAA
ncbi:lysophospholipid acyltransferase family protein [Enterovirga rhinocerotis]|uniref:1-acyl-sn-glycerol-3-phosphate acyltransferase n=1 Tax=Enterovirga rhinocerotis TaxID=1339210 RepID=A0A4V3DYX1_9HYPH|nr:lysophospholipid acyltransferase family protein [Enterovirga rhinocerotis]TDR94329.1 1-acyl-sn-glycerol-3-phosphate acyltransferase [Enterovirga rhinocerotis]